MNLLNYAQVSKHTNIVENIVVWDGEAPIDIDLVNEFILIPINEDTKGKPVDINATYVESENAFIPPKPNAETAQEILNFEWDSNNWEWKISNRTRKMVIDSANSSLEIIANS